MVKNVIIGSFPISKVLVFGGNSYVRGKKMKILDYFIIAHGKECDKRLFSYFKSFSFRG